jgi:hypothetical protein
LSSIVIEDQVGARPPKQAIVLEWNDGVPCTARDLITERVRYEHERINAPTGGLTANEIVYLPDNSSFEKIEVEAAIERALEGFGKMGFVLFADGRQVVGLDEIIRLTPSTKVRFVKLLPLKGG